MHHHNRSPNAINDNVDTNTPSIYCHSDTALHWQLPRLPCGYQTPVFWHMVSRRIPALPYIHCIASSSPLAISGSLMNAGQLVTVTILLAAQHFVVTNRPGKFVPVVLSGRPPNMRAGRLVFIIVMVAEIYHIALLLLTVHLPYLPQAQDRHEFFHAQLFLRATKKHQPWLMHFWWSWRVPPPRPSFYLG